MPPLLKIRSERDQMSAIERRIADFVLENAHLLRDYSSQQLADALKISQSSVVKFSQKLGFKGYPDLKFSVGEAVARDTGNSTTRRSPSNGANAHGARAQDLWQSKSRAEEETRLINPPERVEEIARAIDKASKVFCVGTGTDGLHARAFSLQLSLLGTVAIPHVDPVLMGSQVGTLRKGDVIVIFSESGNHPALAQLLRQCHERQAKVFTITRHTANPLRAHADIALLVSAHDERAHVERLLYQSALQHLLDLVLLALCDGSAQRLEQLDGNLERMAHLLNP